MPGCRQRGRIVFLACPGSAASFHLQQNAGHCVPRIETRRELAAHLRAILESTDRRDAEQRLRKTVDKYDQRAPKLSARMEANVADSFTVFAFPRIQRRLRLVSAVLMEISEEWETEKTYIGMTNLHLPEQVD